MAAMPSIVDMTHCAAATIHDARRCLAQKTVFPHKARQLLEHIIPALRFVLGYFRHLVQDLEGREGSLGFAEPYLTESREFLRKEELYRDRLVREMPALAEPSRNESEEERVRDYVVSCFRLARLSTFQPDNSQEIEEELRRKNALGAQLPFARLSATLRAQYLDEVAVSNLTISITEGHLTARTDRDLVECVSHELRQCLAHLAELDA